MAQYSSQYAQVRISRAARSFRIPSSSVLKNSWFTPGKTTTPKISCPPSQTSWPIRTFLDPSLHRLVTRPTIRPTPTWTTTRTRNLPSLFPISSRRVEAGGSPLRRRLMTSAVGHHQRPGCSDAMSLDAESVSLGGNTSNDTSARSTHMKNVCLVPSSLHWISV